MRRVRLDGEKCSALAGPITIWIYNDRSLYFKDLSIQVVLGGKPQIEETKGVGLINGWTVFQRSKGWNVSNKDTLRQNNISNFRKTESTFENEGIISTAIVSLLYISIFINMRVHADNKSNERIKWGKFHFCADIRLNESKENERVIY